MAFVPKGDEPGDAVEVTREEAATRPLSLKNSDSKLVAAVANRAVVALAAAIVHPAQRGFVGGGKCSATLWT